MPVRTQVLVYLDRGRSLTAEQFTALVACRPQSAAAYTAALFDSVLITGCAAR